MYSYTEDRWSKGVPMPNKESFAGCAVLADQVALIGGGLHGSTLSLYSPSSQTWCTAEAPHSPHHQSAVAAIQDSLFLLVRGCCKLTHACALSMVMQRVW